jgi:regulator of RNase E activity RraA
MSQFVYALLVTAAGKITKDIFRDVLQHAGWNFPTHSRRVLHLNLTPLGLGHVVW